MYCMSIVQKYPIYSSKNTLSLKFSQELNNCFVSKLDEIKTLKA